MPKPRRWPHPPTSRSNGVPHKPVCEAQRSPSRFYYARSRGSGGPYNRNGTPAHPPTPTADPCPRQSLPERTRGIGAPRSGAFTTHVPAERRSRVSSPQTIASPCTVASPQEAASPRRHASRPYDRCSRRIRRIWRWRARHCRCRRRSRLKPAEHQRRILLCVLSAVVCARLLRRARRL